MLACAQHISHEYNGIFPDSPAILQTLPGIGPYTARSICAFAYDMPLISFDTNVQRILARYLYGDKMTHISSEMKHAIESDFQSNRLSGRDINNALMDLGAYTRHIAPTHLTSYPLKQCKWWNTSGALEKTIPKKRSTFPTKDARVCVILHANHSIYYSANEGTYVPWYLPNTHIAHRAYIQEYFRTQYQLEVSVRPAHKQVYEKNIPTLYYRAQIQTGDHNFSIYDHASVPEAYRR